MTEEHLSDLPTDWKWKNFEEISNKICNGISKRQNKDKKGLPVTRIETISQGVINFDKVGYVSDLKDSDIRKYKLIPGDLLFSNINSDLHLGKTALFKNSNITLLHGVNLLLIRPNNEEIISDFLHYLCNFYRFSGKFIDIAHKAVNQSSINQTNLKKLLIPLPPLEEQKRIVEKIEELFTKIDESIIELTNIKIKLNVYRKSILKKTFEFKNEYKIKKIGDFERKGGGTPSTKTAEYWNGNINWITSANINENNKINFEKKITKKGLEKSATNLVPKGSVIIVTRVALGKVAVNEEPTAFSQDCQGIICSNINPYFLMWQIKSIANEIINKGQGTTINGITVGKLNKINIKVPKLEVQKEIVNRLEYQNSLIDKIEETINSALIKKDRLRTSILKNAFSGKLVPQDPDDEPAEELLKK